MIKSDSDCWVLGEKEFRSRLIIGSGKFKNFEENLEALEASGAEMITVSIRRVNITDTDAPRLTDVIDPKKYTYLPNTAGCSNAEEAIRALNLAREAGGWELIKLEIIGDEKTLYPNMLETLRAAKILTKEGFKVMAYCSDDPIFTKQLEEYGCVAVMPLGSPIGSGRGIQNKFNIKLIIENSKIPVIVDAGIGTASDACISMELGSECVLVNSAIAMASNPILMAKAMKLAVEAGRNSFLSGRMKKNNFAIASSTKKDF